MNPLWVVEWRIGNYPWETRLELAFATKDEAIRKAKIMRCKSAYKRFSFRVKKYVKEE